jgi:F0F1-type ATP synthase assembly protein I
MIKRFTKKITTTEGFWFGLKLLGQVTGLLVVGTLLGLGVDGLFGAAPIGLVGCVTIASFAATILVVVETYRALK